MGRVVGVCGLKLKIGVSQQATGGIIKRFDA